LKAYIKLVGITKEKKKKKEGGGRKGNASKMSGKEYIRRSSINNKEANANK